jgi:YVTN family beta-propeller protein
MRARESHHVVAGHYGGTSARWRRVARVTALAALPLAVCVATAVPASAAGGYTVTATIGVGGGPDGVAVDTSTHTAYVTNINDDTVSVIDEASATVTGTIGVGGGPFSVAVDPAAHTAYVTNGGNGTVSVIDETTATVAATIDVGSGSGPDGVAVDPTAHTAYVANGGNGTVSVIDETTATVAATINVGSGPSGVAVDPTVHTAYVANAGNGTVSVIDETTGTVTATINVGSGPSGVAVDPTTHTAYVTNLAGSVSVIDGTAGTVAATVPVGSDPDGVAVDPTSHTAYVADEGANSVSVISVARPAPVTTVTSSRNPSTFGGSVTFTATVGPADGGTVTFSHGAKVLCRAVSLTRSDLTYHATCTTSALPGGRDTITAAYPGDSGYAPATGRLTQTVTRAPTALTASIGISPRLGVTLSATLTTSGRPLSGLPVSFSSGPTHLCTPHTSTRAVATCVLTGPQARLAEQDNDPILAAYPGNTGYQPSSATAPLVFP